MNYQNTFFMIAWFSADRVQWPRNRSLHDTKSGSKAVNANTIKVGKKVAMMAGSCRVLPTSSILGIPSSALI